MLTMLSGQSLLTALAGFVLLSACSPQPEAAAGANSTPGAGTASSILAWSRPASGATVSAPVNELVLHFSPPARLGEVTVTGPEGAMPMMVTAVGEVEHYSLPLSGLGTGSFTVAWRATAQGRGYQGSFAFAVR
jgi:methionine-rich copper-binding protein CopC